MNNKNKIGKIKIKIYIKNIDIKNEILKNIIGIDNINKVSIKFLLLQKIFKIICRKI